MKSLQHRSLDQPLTLTDVKTLCCFPSWQQFPFSFTVQRWGLPHAPCHGRRRGEAERAPLCQLMRSCATASVVAADHRWKLSHRQHYTVKSEGNTGKSQLPTATLFLLRRLIKLLLLSEHCNQERKEHKEDTNGREAV